MGCCSTSLHSCGVFFSLFCRRWIHPAPVAKTNAVFTNIFFVHVGTLWCWIMNEYMHCCKRTQSTYRRCRQCSCEKVLHSQIIVVHADVSRAERCCMKICNLVPCFPSELHAMKLSTRSNKWAAGKKISPSSPRHVYSNCWRDPQRLQVRCPPGVWHSIDLVQQIKPSTRVSCFLRIIPGNIPRQSHPFRNLERNVTRLICVLPHRMISKPQHSFLAMTYFSTMKFCRVQELITCILWKFLRLSEMFLWWWHSSTATAEAFCFARFKIITMQGESGLFCSKDKMLCVDSFHSTGILPLQE